MMETFDQKLDALLEQIDEYHESIEEVSNKIRNLEQRLLKSKSTTPYELLIDTYDREGRTVNTYILWGRCPASRENRFRLLYKSTIPSEDAQYNIVVRPLIETKVEVRLASVAHLEKFVEGYLKEYKRQKEHAMRTAYDDPDFIMW